MTASGQTPRQDPDAEHQAPANQWKTLDKDLHRIGLLEEATQFAARPLVAPGLALAFIVLAGVLAAVATEARPGGLVIAVAAAIGAYMALNIGAKDVANYMGPVVGGRVLTLGRALAIAAILETAGALIAGGDVVRTISFGILKHDAMAEPGHVVWAMMAALLAAALWLNFATWLGAPVSTTHSIVGGVTGAGIAAAGFGAVNWPTLSTIALGWMVSPILSGAIAAALLALIKARILYVPDKIAAGRIWIPILIGLMTGTITIYLIYKGLSALLHVPLWLAAGIGLISGLLGWALWRPIVRYQSLGLENRRKSLRKLFGYPLVAAAAMLSFGHGANDVANAVGPLAAIVWVVQMGIVSGDVAVPLWVMIVGAFGLSVGLLLFGPKLIRLVGSEITKLNPVRAFCVILAAAITVITASSLGLPVSSTHIAIGGIFGVGLYREWYAERQARSQAPQSAAVDPPEERKRRFLVRRAHMAAIGTAWVVTVPVSAGLAAGLYLAMTAIAR